LWLSLARQLCCLTATVSAEYSDAFHLYAGSKGSLSGGETGSAVRSLGFNVSDTDVADKGELLHLSKCHSTRLSTVASAKGSVDLNGFITLAQTFAARGQEDDSGLYEAFRYVSKCLTFCL
jgi:Ca2+-binding EF-hand superfamily protein